MKNLLLLAAADQKQWAVKTMYFEMDEMLLSLLEVYEPLCVSRNGKLLLELPDESMPKVYADPALCRQIFTILLDNAVAYGLGEDGGRIVLRAKYLHPHVEVSVIDHGPGIPDGEKLLIFDRFYRQDQSRRQKEHFGLGLSVAAKLAEIQGVELDVRDTEGGGSTFRVKI